MRGGTGALVKDIADRVESAAGEERFDALVSNADVHPTYSWLYRDESRGRRRARGLERTKWSMSLLVLYFGTNRVHDGLAHHPVMPGPRCRGPLDDVFHGRSLSETFSRHLHAPLVSDPSLAPCQGSAFSVAPPLQQSDWLRPHSAMAASPVSTSRARARIPARRLSA